MIFEPVDMHRFVFGPAFSCSCPFVSPPPSTACRLPQTHSPQSSCSETRTYAHLTPLQPTPCSRTPSLCVSPASLPPLSITQFSNVPDGLGTKMNERFVRLLDVINRGYSGYNTEVRVSSSCLLFPSCLLPPKGRTDCARGSKADFLTDLLVSLCCERR